MITGVGAAGVATTRILPTPEWGTIVGCDRQGAVYEGRPGLDGGQGRVCRGDEPWAGERVGGRGAPGALDVYIGLSQPGAVSVDGIRAMADDAIVFAMANPTPEVAPEELTGLAAVIATGRSDYPNQINNVLAFPGIFRGALDVRARDITEGMKLAAGKAIAQARPLGRARAGVHRSERLQPRGRAPGRRRGLRGGGEETASRAAGGTRRR